MKLPINGSTYNIYERGNGSLTFLFLHYFGGSSRAWQGVISLLGDDVRSVAPDLRGFGDSCAAESGYTVNDYTNDVTEIVRELHIERYILVGHSMGGKIALSLAMNQPQGLEALVLLAPSPPTPEPVSAHSRARLLAGYGDRTSSIETIQQITAHPLPPVLLKIAVEDELRSSRQAWRAWLEHGSREDISACMSQINRPTFAVSGADDPAIPPHVVEQEVVRHIAGARMQVVPRAGHLLPLEAPQAIADLLQTVKAVAFASLNACC